jgi:ethanolamine utilization protein EutP (predicted NTPase)
MPREEMNTSRGFLRGAGRIKIEEIDEVDKTAVGDLVELLSVKNKSSRELFTLV